MSPRIPIPAKLALAAAPLVLAVGGLLTTSVRSTMQAATVQNHATDVVRVWNATLLALDGVEAEKHLNDGSATGDIVAARAATDASRTAVQDAIATIGSPGQIDAARRGFTTKLLEARVNADSADPVQRAKATNDFDLTEDALDEITSLLPPETGDRKAGQMLQALESFGRMTIDLDRLRHYVLDAQKSGAFESSLSFSIVNKVYTSIDRFKAGATTEMLNTWTASGYENKIAALLAKVLVLADDTTDVQATAAAMDVTAFQATVREIEATRATFVTSEVAAQSEKADATKSSGLIKVAFPIIASLLAFFLAFRIARSIVRRIRLVTAKAAEVADVELPKLVSALADPTGKAALPEVVPIEGAGNDEVGDLAASFTAVQTTLVSVAAEQMTVLRRGVSEIFVTLARRNRSLVDSQLNLLDRLEAEVEDPKTLADYYKIDHLATRMRRNTESLLVLANSDSRRRGSTALGIDDVVRASISEVEDYRRIEVLPMESLAIKGPVVADMSHMLAELLDNAANFSPPSTTVRVAGHFTSDGYLLTISDVGVGMAPDRLQALNVLLEHPPIIGLSVEPTLGLSVVSLLARKHGISVELRAMSPGMSVNVMVPANLYDRRGAPDSDASYVADAADDANIGPESLWGGQTAGQAPTTGYDGDSHQTQFDQGGYDNTNDFRNGGLNNGGLNEEIRFGDAPNRFGQPDSAEFPGRRNSAFSFPPSGLPVSTSDPATFGSSGRSALPQRNAAKPDDSYNATTESRYAPAVTFSPEQIARLQASVPSQPRPESQSAWSDAAQARPPQDVQTSLEPNLPPPAETQVDAKPAQSLSSNGLPIRIPGRAKPKTGDDDRVSGSPQPTRVRSSLSAYTRGAAAAKGTHGFSNSGIDHFGPTDSSQGSM